MNQAQRKYAMERLAALEAAALKAATQRHTTVGRILSGAEKLKLIASGDVRLKRDAWPRQCLADAFDFSDEESESKVDLKKLEADKRKIEAAFHGARDELMLGDSAKAFDLIKKLEKEWSK